MIETDEPGRRLSRVRPFAREETKSLATESLRWGCFFFWNEGTSAGWSPAAGGSLVTRVVKSKAMRC